MTPDWNTVRLDLIDIDQSVRTTLRTMRPFFAKHLPGILARFYDKVRRYEPDSALFKNGVMQEAIRRQLQHWELIAACDFGPAYAKSIAEFCDLHHRGGVMPHWYIGCRQMFVADQLMKAIEAEVPVPRFGAAAREARDNKAAMHSAIAKANMFDTEHLVAAYFGINRQLRKTAISEASDRFRAIITSLSSASGELESTARSLSDNANNTTRLASVVANASGDTSNNVRSVALSTEELAGSVREISMRKLPWRSPHSTRTDVRLAPFKLISNSSVPSVIASGVRITAPRSSGPFWLPQSPPSRGCHSPVEDVHGFAGTAASDSFSTTAPSIGGSATTFSTAGFTSAGGSSRL